MRLGVLARLKLVVLMKLIMGEELKRLRSVLAQLAFRRG